MVEFSNIYYISNKAKTNREFKFILCDDLGKLIVENQFVQFLGNKVNKTIYLKNIEEVSLHKSELSWKAPVFFIIIITSAIAIQTNSLQLIITIFILYILLFYILSQYINVLWVNIVYYDSNNELKEMFLAHSNIGILSSSKTQKIYNLISEKQKLDYEEYKSKINTN